MATAAGRTGQPAASYPVLYAPNGSIIGSATCERGAVQRAAGIPKLACETFRARLAERLDGSLAWFVGPVLARTYRT